jgi:pimeloyl-ACP methyl ester carboxylesterase
MKSIYKSADAKQEVLSLYDEKLKSLDIPYQEIDVETSYGRTRIIKTGNKNGKKVVLFHGINAGAPVTLEAVKDLREDYLLFAIDTIGQATKSAETTLNIKDASYALWADEVLEQLEIEGANFIGISYGSYILQKLITHKPKRILKAVFIVPSGLVNGKMLPSMTKLSFPLMRYMMTKKEQHLKAFTGAFVAEEDQFMFRIQKALLDGVNIDYRRPILLKEKQVSHFTNPVYIMVSDDDIFFPGDLAIKRAKQIFKNIAGLHHLKNCKHIPGLSTYPEIQGMIKGWLG